MGELFVMYCILFLKIKVLTGLNCITLEKYTLTAKSKKVLLLIRAVIWMRIRSDPHSFGSVDPDPDAEV